AARELYPGRRLRALFQPHLYSRTRHLAPELAAALAGADDIAVTDIYAAREQPVPGVTGKLIVDALSDLGRLAAWMPTRDAGVDYPAPRHEQGGAVASIGAGAARGRVASCSRSARATSIGRRRSSVRDSADEGRGAVCALACDHDRDR